MLTCTSCRAKLADYLDDLLASRQRAEVAAHLEDCEACSRHFATERTLRFATRELSQVAPPAELRGRIRAAVYKERDKALAPKPAWTSILTGRSTGWVWAGGASLAACGFILLARIEPPPQAIIPIDDATPAAAQTAPAHPHTAKSPSTAHAKPQVAAHSAGTSKPVEVPLPRVAVRSEVDSAENHASTPVRHAASAGHTRPRVAVKPVERPVTHGGTVKPPVVTPVQTSAPHLETATTRPTTPDVPPATANDNAFLASAVWVENGKATGEAPVQLPDALHANPDGGQTGTGAPKAIKLKVTPQRDVTNGQIRAILPKSEDGKAAGAEEVIWSGDATAKAPIAILWEPPVNSARTNVTLTVVLEQLDADGKATPVQTQQVTVGTPDK